MPKWKLKTVKNKLLPQFLLKASTLRSKRKSTKKILIPMLIFKIINNLLLRLRKTKRMLRKIKKRNWLQLMKNRYKIKLMLKWKMKILLKMLLWNLNKPNKSLKILKFKMLMKKCKKKKVLKIQKKLRKKLKPKMIRKWKKKRLNSKKLSANKRLPRLMLKSKMCIFILQETFQEK